MALYVVNTLEDELNYRDGPGKHSRKIGSLPAGAIVLGEDVGGWVRTTLQAETCYLSKEYLEHVKPSCTLCYTDDDIVEVIHWLEGLL